jgi:hypothetical protein
MSVACLGLGWIFMKPLFIVVAKYLILPIALLSVGMMEFVLFVWALFCTLVGLGFYFYGAVAMMQFIVCLVKVIFPKREDGYATA